LEICQLQRAFKNIRAQYNLAGPRKENILTLTHEIWPSGSQAADNPMANVVKFDQLKKTIQDTMSQVLGQNTLHLTYLPVTPVMIVVYPISSSAFGPVTSEI